MKSLQNLSFNYHQIHTLHVSLLGNSKNPKYLETHKIVTKFEQCNVAMDKYAHIVNRECYQYQTNLNLHLLF